MPWRLLTPADYVTTRWSGGTTTQLAIGPEGASYASRDFLWRLSSAKVELEHSDFTPLPDFNRFLSILDGELEIKVGGGARTPLPRLTVLPFDGGEVTESWGKCTDFNLMVRKGVCEGRVQPLSLGPGGALTLFPVASGEYPHMALAFYCVSGGFTLIKEGIAVKGGELLLCREGDIQPVGIASSLGAVFLAVSVRSKR